MRGAKPGRAIEEAIEREGAILRGERILVACSGGPDSVVLAALLHAVAPRLRLELTLGHVNHGLRESAWQDEAVVLAVGTALGLDVKVAALAPGPPDENRLRVSRYGALAVMAAQAGAGSVATGHCAQDQTETVLLALFRGTGPAGLTGMPARRRLAGGIDLVRPLLRFDREDLRTALLASGLPYAVDPTNADPLYRRNAVRSALEGLRPIFPGLDAAVARAAALLAEEEAATPEAALRKQVREALREQEALAEVDFNHVEAAVRALRCGGSGRFFMARGVELTIENGTLTVHQE